MDENDVRFIRYATRRDRLSGILQELSQTYLELGNQEYASSLASSRDTLLNNNFIISFTGTMKTGKSSLINALLGESILPVKHRSSCTAIPISLQFGKDRQAVCDTRSGCGFEKFILPDNIDDFGNAVSISTDDHHYNPMDDPSHENTHPFLSADVYCPSEILKGDVKLVDTPGYGENTQRDKLAWNQCEKSDAIVFLPDTDKLGTDTDRKRLRKIIETGRNPQTLFMVWNKVDQPLGDDSDSENLQQAAYAMSDPMGVPREHIFFLSAKLAIEGLRSGISQEIVASGVPKLKQFLGVFLEDTADTKLLTPLSIAENAANDAVNVWLPKYASRASLNMEHATDAASTSNVYMQQSRIAQRKLASVIEREKNHYRFKYPNTLVSS